MVGPRKCVRSRDCVAAARDLRVPSLRGDAEQPGGQLVGERVLRRLKAALDTLPGPRLRGPSVGCSSRRRGGRDLRGSGGGTAPREPPQGTHGVWPRGVCWLSRLSGKTRPSARGSVVHRNLHPRTSMEPVSGGVVDAQDRDIR